MITEPSPGHLALSFAAFSIATCCNASSRVALEGGRPNVCWICFADSCMLLYNKSRKTCSSILNILSAKIQFFLNKQNYLGCFSKKNRKIWLIIEIFLFFCRCNPYGEQRTWLRLHTDQTPFREPSLKIGRELSRQLNIGPAVVLGAWKVIRK